MKTSFLMTCVVGLLLATAGVAQTPATAAPALPGPPTATGPSKVGFIDFQQAISDTAQGAQLVANLKTRFAPRQAAMEKSNSEIQALQKQLSDGGSTMSAEAKQQLNQEIQTKQRDLQQAAQNAQSDYQSAVEDVVNQVGTKMMPIIQSYAKEHGYSVVMDGGLRWPQSPLLYQQSGTDITGVIVQLYNKQYPATSH